LRCLRSDLEPRMLWVDQVCINMADIAERNCQVKVMGDIYNGAETVCVWLGEVDGSSRTAFEFIRNMAHAPALYQISDWNMPNPNIAALFALMRRPWFSRCWIVQEISLARNATVHCGDDSVNWSDFADVVLLVAKQSTGLPGTGSTKGIDLTSVESKIGLTEWGKLGAIQLIKSLPSLVRKLDNGHIAEKTFSLEALICGLSDLHCSDPRDKIYAWWAHSAINNECPDMAGLYRFWEIPN
jgi:heterokaryon incompatibility protein (HET)